MSEPIRSFIQNLEITKIELNESMNSINYEINHIEGVAERRIKLYGYLLLLLTLSQFGFFYYTIFEIDYLGWDIMEPITYSVGVVGWVFAMRFYAKYRKVRSIESLFQVSKENFILKSPGFRFRYMQLQNNLKDVEKEIDYINKSINFYRQRDSLN